MKSHISILLLFVVTVSYSQDNEAKKEAPNFKFFRAEESYGYLKDKGQSEYQKEGFDALKFISLSKNRNSYASIGGEIRPRFEHFSNLKWDKNKDEDYYSQRLALHTNFVFGKNIRVFGELYSGYTSHRKKPVQYDEINLHQAFVEVIFPLVETQSLSFRFGRQEMGLGTTRLVGVREGPNIRRSFDASRVIYKSGSLTLQAFYAKEVLPNFFPFDNDFTLFDSDVPNPSLWGIYSQFVLGGLPGNNEVYYLGFESNSSKYSDISGKEMRHTVGLRRFGDIGKRLSFNTEVMYQFGTLGSATVSAFNIGTDTRYRLINTNWMPTFGLRLNWSSGDNNKGDDKLNTFNPLYVNPSFYGISANIIPLNLFSIHPSISISPSEKWNIRMDWGIFWRASKDDGLYALPRFLVREDDGITDKNIGNQFGLSSSYQVNRHLSLKLNMSYFIAGGYLEESGTSDNIFHFAPTVTFKF